MKLKITRATSHYFVCHKADTAHCSQVNFYGTGLFVITRIGKEENILTSVSMELEVASRNSKFT